MAAAANFSLAQEENSIADAKKEFQAVKSAREAALQPKAALPTVRMPEMQGVAPSLGVSPLPKKADANPKKSGNWLVEAMEKQSAAERNDRARDARGSRDARGERDQEGVAELFATSEGAERSQTTELGDEEKLRRDESRAADERKERSLVVNPLSRFLGEWMTPQDYALLKPGLEQSMTGANNVRLGLDALTQQSITTELGSSGRDGSLSENAATAAGANSALRENPYLQALNLPGTGHATTQASAAAIVVPAPPVRIENVSPASGPPPPIVTPKSKMPDFVKPATDEKYFKQLKRF